MSTKMRRVCTGTTATTRQPCRASAVSGLDRCAAHAGPAMLALGVEAAVAVRPDQVMAWPGTTEDGCESVWVVVTHRKKRGARNLSMPRSHWAAAVELEDGWWDSLHTYPFGVFFGVEGLWDQPEDEPALVLHRVEWANAGDETVAILWFDISAGPEWEGRWLTASSVDRGQPDEDGIYPPPVDVEERVGLIVGRTRRVEVEAGATGQPWATVFELGTEAALVLGDQLQAQGRSADGRVITHAALRQRLDPQIRRDLGLE